MAERAVIWVDGVQVPGRDLRLAQTALLTPASSLVARSGVLSGLEVTATAPATRAVSVAAGQCAVTVTETAPGGVAICTNDATVTVPIAAADPTNPRIDLAVARVYAELTAAGSRRWALEMVQGTPAAIPDAPALPANSLLLRAVTVPANASSITSAELGTTLPARTAAAGGITPSRDAADVAGVVGQYRDRLDAPPTGRLERHNGTAWGGAATVLFAGGSQPLAGAAAPDGAPLLVQHTRSVVSTNAQGDLTVSLPRAFTSSLLFATLQVYDVTFGAWCNPTGGTIAGGAGGVATVTGRLWTGASAGASAVVNAANVPVLCIAYGI